MTPSPERVPPLRDAIALTETKLRQAVMNANRSPLYRQRWRAAHVDPTSVRQVKDLAPFPYITRQEVFAATRVLRSRVACSPVYAWFAGSSSTASYEWVPFSAQDFLGIAPRIARMSRILNLQAGDIVLAVTDPAPRIFSYIPFLWTTSTSGNGVRLEFLTVALAWYENLGMTWLDFIQRRPPTVLFTSVTNALALAHKIQTVCHADVKDVLSKTRMGILYGSVLNNTRSQLYEIYPFPLHKIYSPTEHMAFGCECRPHQGIHLWMDTCIPEIIPTRSAEGIPLWEASPHTRGELVLTTFAECLPLIRYRTGETIMVGDRDCSCGHDHPTIS